MNQPDWIDREEYPFESKYFSLDMGRRHYLDEGRGEPVVMVQGNPTWSFLYCKLIKINNPQNVKRVVIIHTWMWPVNDDLSFAVFSKLMGGPVGRFLIKRYNLFASVMIRQLFGDKSQLTPPIHKHYIKPLDRPEKRKGCWTLPGQILGSTHWLGALAN
ncbi:MAG: hypothetical protein HYZ68_02050 [Chloroflexi bacterium]|nr:hypothetical protein [Chloroflexota bacterium]